MPTTFDWTLVAAVIAAVVSAVSAYFSYQSSKKTTFINTITSERLRWMEELRRTVAKICGLIYHWNLTGKDTPQRNEIIKEVDDLMQLVKLQLNPDKTEHKEILDLIKESLNYTDTDRIEKLAEHLDKIIESSQTLLNYEWERVKREAREGELSRKETINSWLPSNVRESIYGRQITETHGSRISP